MDLERLNIKQFERFQSFIYDCCGIRIELNKVTLVSNRIRRRLRALNLTDFDEYYRHLNSKSGREELGDFLAAITTNETFFFRTSTHFDWVTKVFAKELLASNAAKKRSPMIRIWSAACSSGEEPYSIAISLLEASSLFRDWNISVLGTDISEDVLAMARTGVYRENALRGVDSAIIAKYFTKKDDKWSVLPSVTNIVKFRNHNLMQPLGLSDFDCIFLRNVLIYFDRQSKATVIEHIVRSLAPNGYLVVGPSEGIYDMLGMLNKVSSHLYQKPSIKPSP